MERMKRSDLVLAALATGSLHQYKPVQVQKMFFLIEENIPECVDEHFHFEPYNYGPFDKEVYNELERLSSRGDIHIGRESRWNYYQLTQNGLKKGIELLNQLPDPIREYIEAVSEFVRTSSFTELVSAIYEAYPDMKVNSVFQD